MASSRAKAYSLDTYDLSEEYRTYCEKFKAAYQFLCQHSKNREKTVNEICEIRRYEPSRMAGILLKSGFIFVNEDTDFDKLKGKAFKDLALFTSKGDFMLSDRYIFPVKDMVGNIVALIGWKEGNYKSKYLTTPSKFFSKNTMFFGLEQISQTGLNRNYFVTEGIFDSLSLRSLGFNAIAQMGSIASRNKQVLYTLFKRLIAISDMDSVGRKVLVNDEWQIPTNGSYLNWRIPGASIKDIDELIQVIDEENLKEILTDVWSEKERIITLEV